MDWLKAIGLFLACLCGIGVVVGLIALFAAIGAAGGLVLLGIIIVCAVLQGIYEACKPKRRR